MSINKKRFSIAAVIFAEILLSALIITAQNLELKIKINAASPNLAQISGKLPKSSDKNWFFLKSVANADNLGKRISHLELFDAQNQTVTAKKLIEGEYLAAAESAKFQYQINLEPLPNTMTKAHVSWISGEQGILMLDDLLPQNSVNNQLVAGDIKFELPDDWKIFSSESSSGENSFETKNIAKAVFIIGKNWRETKLGNMNLIASGEWQFSDAEAIQMANEIFEKYRKLFREKTSDKVVVVLAPLPKDAKFGRWGAETRGRTLTILSAGKAFKAQSVQLLHEQLRHELFHLWIPNKLNLTGNYDWFYEGFTVYQALRTGLQMNQIRFEDFLATIGEAYNLDNFQTTKSSLVESSKNRWNAGNPQVYARGMIIAFLCDIALLREGKNNHSIENVFKEIYRKHQFPNEAIDGNTAILNDLKNYKSIDSIVKKYIEGAEKIDWDSELQSIGIETAAENSFVKLSVKAKLNGRQKDLLDKLGYNNWQKISRNPK